MKSIQQMTFADIRDIAQGMDTKMWVLLGSGLLGGVLFVVFLAFPAWILRWDVKAKQSSVSTQISSVEHLIKQRPALEEKRKTEQLFIQNAKQALFKSEEMSLLLGTISKLANEAQVSIVSSSPQEQTEKFPAPFDLQYESGIYSFSVEGGYHDIANLIAKIESYPKLLRVQSFDIRPVIEEGKSGVQISNINVSAVAQRDPSKLPVPKDKKNAKKAKPKR